MEILKKLKKIKTGEIHDLDGWIGDAEFGVKQLSAYFNNRKKLNVLEIGCGIGILLACIKTKFPNIKVEGIEPYKGGFKRLKIKKRLIPRDININNLDFEIFKPEKKYDVIYSVNVFEHLLNWQLYLKKTNEWLKPEGINIILCPNYSFPYESHFKIPIILNKKITYFFFKNKIEKFESENKSFGLWNSLNFVKLRSVKNYCLNNQLKLKYCDQVFYDIVNRIEDDKAFKKRQSFVGLCARLLNRLGLISFLNNKIFHYVHPYMKLEITKKKLYEKN